MQRACIKRAGSERLDQQIRPYCIHDSSSRLRPDADVHRMGGSKRSALVGRGQGLGQLFPLSHQTFKFCSMIP